MSQKFAEAEIIEAGNSETWRVPVDEPARRVAKGALITKEAIKKETQQETDRFAQSGLKWVNPRFDMTTALNMMDISVWHARCVRLKAKMVGGLGWKLINIEDPEMRPDDDALGKELHQLFKRPNPRFFVDNFDTIIKKFLIDHYATGNSYLEVSRNARNEVAEFYHARAEYYRRSADIKSGKYFQIINPAQPVSFYQFGAKKTDASKNEILHYLNYDPSDDYYGIGDWYPAMADLVMDRTSVEYLLNTFRNQLVAKFVVIVEGGKMSEKGRANLKEFIQRNATGAKNGGTTLILDTDDPNVKIRIEKLEVSFGEKGGWMKEVRHESRDQVIAAHGVLPRLVGVMTAGQLGGGGEMREQLASFYEIEMHPEQEQLEELINNTILASYRDGDHPWRIDFNEIDTTDEAAVSKMVKELVGKPVMTVSEGRDRVGLKDASDETLRELEDGQTTVFLEKVRKQVEKFESAVGVCSHAH